MYRVLYSAHAEKTLRKMDRLTAAFLLSWIEKNLVGCENPREKGKALTGDKTGCWSYRIGDCRILADIRDDILLIEGITIGHRREVYRR